MSSRKKADAGVPLRIVQVVVGSQHCALLTSEGVVYTWGKHTENQLGRNCASEEQKINPFPVDLFAVTQPGGVVQIAAGSYHTVVLDAQGCVFCWGKNSSGQCGKRPRDQNDAVKTPVEGQVVCFGPHGKEGEKKKGLARAIGAGPYSSAATTTEGDIFVWGEIYGRYLEILKIDSHPDLPPRHLDPSTPFRIYEAGKGRGGDYLPDRVSVWRDWICGTVSHRDPLDDVRERLERVKQRQTSTRAQAQAKGAGRGGGAQNDGGGGTLEDVQEMIDANQKDMNGELATIATAEKTIMQCDIEMARIQRELTVCDQQEVHFQEQADQLEVEGPGGEQTKGAPRQIETQLNDIRRFRQAVAKRKLELHQEKVTENLKRAEAMEKIALSKERMQRLRSRQKLFDTLGRSATTTGGASGLEATLRVAYAKFRELQDTGILKMAETGKFDGIQEVISTSHRALNDISLAIKEISAASSVVGGDPKRSAADAKLLEDLVEENLKLRKTIGEVIEEKVRRAESGDHHQNKEAGDHDLAGMAEFFKECSMVVPRYQKEAEAKSPSRG